MIIARPRHSIRPATHSPLQLRASASFARALTPRVHAVRWQRTYSTVHLPRPPPSRAAQSRLFTLPGLRRAVRVTAAVYLLRCAVSWPWLTTCSMDWDDGSSASCGAGVHPMDITSRQPCTTKEKARADRAWRALGRRLTWGKPNGP